MNMIRCSLRSSNIALPLIILYLKMRNHRAPKRRGGFVNTVLHHGREFMRHTDVFVRQFGPALKIAAMSATPALAVAGLPQAAAATAVLGNAADGYSQLRPQLLEWRL